MVRKVSYIMLLASLAAMPVVFTTGCAVTHGRESVGEYASDKTIKARIKTAMYADPAVKGTQVEVQSLQGNVLLSGFVDTQAEKDRAGQIAQSTRGVKSVRNDLVVATGRDLKNNPPPPVNPPPQESPPPTTTNP